MKILKQVNIKPILFVGFLIFIGISYFVEFTPGILIAGNFKDFLLQMVMVIPPIFLLIGLFDVWIKRETIIKHLGKGGGIKSFLWVFILAAPMAGGLLPGFPIAYSLYQKGARLSVIFVFLGAVGIGRLPMVFFEATFLGWRFSVIRIVASIPLVIIAGIFLGKLFEKKDYKLPNGNMLNQ
ncbi:MAG: permease [Candidatus Marinimicrobia bacterium]|nr:permease [Candidatus Neomarinimicrobiota bacterium]